MTDATDLPPIFVINLKRSVERRRIIAARLIDLNLPHSFFEAVDGTSLSVEDKASYAGTRRRLFFGHDLTPGEIGCLLSHRGIYRHMIANSIQAALVLEDDAILADDLPDVLRALMRCPIEWDLIRFLARDKVYKQSRCLGFLSEKHRLCRPLGTPGGAYGYILTLQAAHALNNCMHKNWTPVDTLHGQTWRTFVNAFNVQPSPVHFDDVIESTIGAARFDKKQKLSFWESSLFPLSRFSMKLYEILFKSLTRILTWPGDRLRSRRLRQPASTTSR